MKEHGLIVATSGVQAILEGRKTQTRRVIKEQNLLNEAYKIYGDRPTPSMGAYWLIDGDSITIKCPYGQVGDRLLIKETHKLTRKPEGVICQYKDGDECYFSWTAIPQKQRTRLGRIKTWGKWRSSRFMYNFLVRHKVEITGVRVERLQEITSDDVLVEGLPQAGEILIHPHVVGKPLIHAFANLWDFLNAKRGYGWETNPWVWVIEFKEKQ